MSKSYITFIDNSGRNILGVKGASTGDEITVQNPVMVLVQPTQDGKLQVQLIPLFLAEFVESKGGEKSFSFRYPKSQIAIGVDFSVDARILEQYDRVVSGIPAIQPKPASDTPEVVKLFED